MFPSHDPCGPGLPTFCTVDFGYRMPAVVWTQTERIAGEQHIRIFDEILHETNIKTEDLAKRILRKRYNTIRYYGDPAGINKQSQSGLGDIEIFRKFNIHIHSVRDRVSRDIEAGISHVRGFVENANKKRYIHVHHKCIKVCEDFENYRYPEHKEGSDLKKLPVKDGFHDHGMDAIRYFFINRFPIKNNKLEFARR